MADLDKVYNDTSIPQDEFLRTLQKMPIATNEAVASAADWIKANKDSAEALKLVALAGDFAEYPQVSSDVRWLYGALALVLLMSVVLSDQLRHIKKTTR